MEQNGNSDNDDVIIPSIQKIRTTNSKDYEKLEKPPPGVGTWISTRFGLAYLAFFGFVNVYALRVNLSVAILSMVNSSYLINPVSNTTDSMACPAGPPPSHSGAEFNWNASERGLVLGAFFYGYILTQLPGGYLASRFGGKILFGCGVLCTSVLTLLTPIAARTSFPLLIAVRVVEGIGEGVTFPAMHAMWGVWAPPLERSRLVSLTYAGSQFGTVLAQPISGILCASTFMGGWPSVFYVFGTLGIIWCCVWFLLAHNKPSDHPWISQSELQYIESTIEPTSGKLEVPWYEIATSKEVWAISIAHFGNNWGFYTLLTSLPTYLKDVLHFDITQDGFISALPYFMMWVSINFCGVICDKLREKGILSTTQARKAFQTVSMIGPAVCLITAGYVGCNKVAAIVFICLATMFNGASFPGFNSNHIDIAPRYAGILMGITNSWATIPGFASPAVVGILTENNSTHGQWLIVFYIAGGVYVVAAALYLLLGSGVEQPWNRKVKCHPGEEQSLLQNDGNEDKH